MRATGPGGQRFGTGSDWDRSFLRQDDRGAKAIASHRRAHSLNRTTADDGERGSRTRRPPSIVVRSVELRRCL